jgi:predicted nucleic acid-binding protein
MVVDASVLVDMLITNRQRHPLALKLAQHIKTSGLSVTIPIYAVLEIKCAIDAERRTPGHGNLRSDIFSENDPLKVLTIPIDNAFLQKYLDLSVPYIRTGDLCYILIAKKHGCPLITEDAQQYDVAKKVGVSAYRIAEYLDLISKS